MNLSDNCAAFHTRTVDSHTAQLDADDRWSHRWSWRSLFWWLPPRCPSGSLSLWQSCPTRTRPQGRSTRSAWPFGRLRRWPWCSPAHSPNPAVEVHGPWEEALNRTEDRWNKTLPHHPAGGDSCCDGCGAGGGFLVKLFSGDKVDGQSDPDLVLLSFGHQVLDDAGALLVIQGCTNLEAKTLNENRLMMIQPGEFPLNCCKKKKKIPFNFMRLCSDVLCFFIVNETHCFSDRVLN